MICYKNHIYVILRYILFFFIFSFVLCSIPRCQILLSYTFFDIEYYYYLSSSLYPFFLFHSKYLYQKILYFLFSIYFIHFSFSFLGKEKLKHKKSSKKQLKIHSLLMWSKSFFISFYMHTTFRVFSTLLRNII